jgi:hypothetical protein
MIKIDERDLYQLLISEFRYAVKRDNHLAPGSCVQHVMDYLPEFSKQWKSHTAYQLTNEIIAERVFSYKFGRKLDYDNDWEKLLVFLINYLEVVPSNAEKYMTTLYGKTDCVANINYNSDEIIKKIKKNQECDI